MNGITTLTFLVVSFMAVSHGHSHSRVNTRPLYNPQRDLGLGCSYEEVGTLVALVRALEEKECASDTSATNGSISNADDLIMNLVNALIQLTTQALSQHSCHCPNQSGNNNIHPTYPGNGGSGNNYPTPNHNGGSGYSKSDGGLLNVDLLNSKKKDNVLDLDLAGQQVLGVGLGGGGGGKPQGSNGYYNSNGGNANEGLLNVDLLNPKKTNNVADVDLLNKPLVGVSLGGNGNMPARGTNSMTGSSSNGSNSGEGLVNVDLLNPNKSNNVADVDLVGKNVIGVGL